MKNKILLGIVVILSIVLGIVVSFKKETNFSFGEEKNTPPIEEKKSQTISLLYTKTNEIQELDLEEYVKGVVAAEMPASFEMEALKAQAIASRTFAIYKKNHRTLEYDVMSGVSDQAYNSIEEMKSKWKDQFDANYAKISDAVNQTEGMIMTYEGNVIESFYFSMSNGFTERSELVFQESLPYMESVESKWENESLNNYLVTKTFTKDNFCQLLGITCPQIDIKDIERTNSNRVNTITINDKKFRGVEVRKLLTLRSTDFEITIKDDVTVTTKGNGHGVGMSQYGANGMAKEGFKVNDILNHYYQNVTISKI